MVAVGGGLVVVVVVAVAALLEVLEVVVGRVVRGVVGAGVAGGGITPDVSLLLAPHAVATTPAAAALNKARKRLRSMSPFLDGAEGGCDQQPS